VLPHIHIIFAFLWCVLNIEPESSHPYVTILLGHVPWREVSDFLNHTLAASRNIGLEYEVTGFPVYEGESARPLSEDAQIDGQGWSCDYYSKDWLPKEVSDDDDPLHEPPSVTNARRQRILWLGVKFAQCGRCGIEYNSAHKSWSVSGTVSAHRQVELSAEPLQVDRDIHMGPKQSTYQGQRTAYSEAESVDVDMPDVDDFVERRTSDHSSEDDSPEMKEIQERQPRGAAQSPTSPGNQFQNYDPQSTKAMAIQVVEFLRTFKIVVCDANFFLNQLDVFRIIVERGEWVVIVPNNGA